MFEKDYESSLLHCFPALDKTASIRRPNEGVGQRFKKFLNDQRNIIAPIGLGMMMGQGCTFGGISFEEAIYNLARNHLVHEGGFAENLKISDDRKSILGGNWNLSEANILSLIIATISAKENKDESFSKEIQIKLLGQQVNLNKLWGEEDELRRKIELKFHRAK